MRKKYFLKHYQDSEVLFYKIFVAIYAKVILNYDYYIFTISFDIMVKFNKQRIFLAFFSIQTLFFQLY